jgi:hypothetical protein
MSLSEKVITRSFISVAKYFFSEDTLELLKVCECEQNARLKILIPKIRIDLFII